MVVSAVLIAEQIIRVRNGHGGYEVGSPGVTNEPDWIIRFCAVNKLASVIPLRFQARTCCSE